MNLTLIYRKAYVTHIMAAINVTVFLVMISGGALKADRIYRAQVLLVPVSLSSLKWWELVTTNFFHRTAAHLLLNIFILYLLGPYLEYVLGRVRYLLCYLASGVGAMLMVVLCAIVFETHVPQLRVAVPQLIAGASGCIMGIVGGHGAVALRNLTTERDGGALYHLLFMLMLVLLQLGYDLTSFNVSIGAHLFGAVIGFLLVLLLKPNPATQPATHTPVTI